jgi:hypothetical protein
MFNKPMLGGLNVKAASAYLLPPPLKPRKKKQKTKLENLPEENESLDKQASALADAIVFEKQAELYRKIESGDLGGGWNPHDQINPIQ